MDLPAVQARPLAVETQLFDAAHRLRPCSEHRPEMDGGRVAGASRRRKHRRYDPELIRRPRAAGHCAMRSALSSASIRNGSFRDARRFEAFSILLRTAARPGANIVLAASGATPLSTRWPQCGGWTSAMSGCSLRAWFPAAREGRAEGGGRRDRCSRWSTRLSLESGGAPSAPRGEIGGIGSSLAAKARAASSSTRYYHPPLYFGDLPAAASASGDPPRRDRDGRHVEGAVAGRHCASALAGRVFQRTGSGANRWSMTGSYFTIIQQARRCWSGLAAQRLCQSRGGGGGGEVLLSKTARGWQAARILLRCRSSWSVCRTRSPGQARRRHRVLPVVPRWARQSAILRGSCG